MPYVSVKSEYQVTIPISLRKAINIHEGDTLQACIENGNIVFIPQIIKTKNNTLKNKKPSIMSMVGANQGSGLYDSAKDIDNTILDMREQWD